jgi:2-oxoglutarate dehydrogenase E1 component
VSRLHTIAASSAYVQAMLNGYRADPASVPADWRAALDLLTAYFPDLESGGRQASSDEALRRYGHLLADLDPLRRALPRRWADLAAAAVEISRTSQDTLLPAAYCGPLAIETGHLDDPAKAAWLHARRETPKGSSSSVRQRALEAIVRGEVFERTLGVRFPGKKRFGAEGAESVHALVGRLIDRAAAAGFAEVVIGSMHRGRLGMMATVFGQPLEVLIARMRGGYPLGEGGRAADVPYHAGLDRQVTTPTGPIRLRLMANPSHLEAVNPVACGFARGRQETLGGAGKVLPIVLHTDASVVAQGVVSETLQLSGVDGHSIGGTVNVVINNQVGFTTDPEEARTSRHCTGAWKAIDSLIVHANADEIDAVLSAADLAFDYREAFAAEAVVDLVCVRANGHNELDEPRFTQPAYYAAAAGRTSISARYEAALLKDGVVDPTLVQTTAAALAKDLDAAFDAEGGTAVETADPATETSVPFSPEPLDAIVALAARPPAGQFHSKTLRLVAQRAEEVAQAQIGWATAEVLAIGTVLSAGRDVRLTGQDVQRGSFSQRHLVLVGEDGVRAQVFDPPPTGWGRLEIYNTPLSEYAALGFEYGYALARPERLTIWEAQFGDFANGAQIVFDQFIASGEEKWSQLASLVILMPHGLEGQGPEHSSARIERVLQLAARGNMHIAHPSTPASYFQLLIGQARSGQRPLVVFTPKKLLRLKACVSTARELGPMLAFKPVLLDAGAEPIRRLVVCSGKIAYELAEMRATAGETGTGIVRLEQLYPFPRRELAKILRAHRDAEVVWLQEEPRNFGAWAWLRERLDPLLAATGRGPLRCIARPESPSPAGSFHGDHDKDQAQLIALALNGGLSQARSSM